MTAGHASAVVGRKLPALVRLIPIRGLHLGAEANVAPEIMTVGDEAEIAQDFGLGCVFLRPRPCLVQLRIEGVAVVDGLDVAARAGIAVPVPGAADITGLLQHDCRKTGLAQAMQEIEAGKAGAYDRDVDNLRCCAACRVRSTCCNSCVLHAILPCVLILREASPER